MGPIFYGLKFAEKNVDGINFCCFTVDRIASNYWRRVVKNRDTKQLSKLSLAPVVTC
jgi:hypothetical protein